MEKKKRLGKTDKEGKNSLTDSPSIFWAPIQRCLWKNIFIDKTWIVSPLCFPIFLPQFKQATGFLFLYILPQGRILQISWDIVSECSSPLRRMGFEDGKIPTRIVRISWIDERKESSVGPWSLQPAH